MGNALPKAVESVVVKRFGGSAFRVGFAEMNGWRTSMEDAHVVFMQDSWGFFGVFDGHGGSQCSTFVAQRLVEELRKAPDEPPQDDGAMKSLALRLDAEFLDTGQSSGSTGTFAIVKAPEEAGGRYCLRVGNVGDSRVLLARQDGTMIEGEGTDGGLTTDHKPDYPGERARIERNGGRVEAAMGGVARVNGELAVSRAFGDSQFKETGGPGPEERPVTANPEFVTLECDPSDFVIFVCDGISEGEFPNREVVKLASEQLWKKGNKQVDPGAAAAAVCRRALERGSRDNLSVMILMLGGGEVPGEKCEFLAGPLDSVGDAGFRTAYAAMAEHAGLTLAQAAELRHGYLQKMLAEPGRAAAEAGPRVVAGEEEVDREALARELDKFDGGPAEEDGPVGSDDRIAWFENWLISMQEGGGGGESDAACTIPPGLLQMLGSPQIRQALAMNSGQSGGAPGGEP